MSRGRPHALGNVRGDEVLLSAKFLFISYPKLKMSVTIFFLAKTVDQALELLERSTTDMTFDGVPFCFIVHFNCLVEVSLIKGQRSFST